MAIIKDCPSATGQVQARENSPERAQRSTTELPVHHSTNLAKTFPFASVNIEVCIVTESPNRDVGRHAPCMSPNTVILNQLRYRYRYRYRLQIFSFDVWKLLTGQRPEAPTS